MNSDYFEKFVTSNQDTTQQQAFRLYRNILTQYNIHKWHSGSICNSFELSSMFRCFLLYISTSVLGPVSATAADKDVCSDPDGSYPHPTDCRSYYQCSKGLLALVNCPVDQVFDEKTKYCVLAHLNETHCSEGKRISYYF